MKSFQELGLPKDLNDALTRIKFNEPTPIQAEAIPHALDGKDLLGSAQTGTGKTAAFGIPLIARLLNDPKSAGLVMTPTRELATQVYTQLQSMLGNNKKVKVALLIGGDSMHKQLRQLRNKPRLIVGTPGRINDHLERRNVSLKSSNFLVLDETDRMLDMGFSVQIESILKHMPEKRQTLLFSATLPKNIVRIADKYLTDPVRISVSPTSSPAERIKQETIRLQDSEKYDRLVHELGERQGSVIIFIKTKYGTEKMAKRLCKEGFRADAIHGDLRQGRRDRVITAFRKKKFNILVATDVAARGLDIPHIEHVINYDLPQCAEDYIHRIGRTARAGAEGAALNLVAPIDNAKWRAIEELLNPGKKQSKKKPNRKRRYASGKTNKNAANKKSTGKKPFARKSKPKNTDKPARKHKRPNKKAA